MPPAKPKYDESSITTLSPREHVRLNVSMFLGSADGDGAYHGAREIIDNACDEALGGHATKIRVVIDDDRRGMQVSDNGRGVPYGKSKDTGNSVLVDAFGTVFTGGKFKDSKSAYSTALGLHGIGSKATNFTSSEFVVESVVKPGEKATARWERGELKAGGVKIVAAKSKSTGTTVRFRPDYEQVFKDAGPFDIKRVRNRLRELSFLLPGVEFEFVTAGQEPKTFASKDKTLASMLEWRAGSKLTVPAWTVTNLPVEVKTTNGKGKALVDVALSWVDALDDQQIDAFTNIGPNPEGGTHAKAVFNAVTTEFLRLARGKCSVQEISKGMRACVHMRHPSPEFKGQTKDALVNKDVTEVVSAALVKPLRKWIKENKAWVDEFIASCISAFEQRSLSKATRTALRDLLPKKGQEGLAPGKALEKPRCPAEEREIIIVEGDSAAGNLKAIARQNHYMEVLPLRGKVINTVRADLGKVLKNKEYATIIRMVGVGIDDEIDMTKCRHARIILAADADPDGAHIESLLLSFFVTHMRPVVEAGKLYALRSPLFRALSTRTGKHFYGDSVEEIAQKNGGSTNSLEITRMKGHGEASKNDLKVYAGDPATRKLVRLTMDSAAVKRVLAVMAEDTTARKEMLGLSVE